MNVKIFRHFYDYHFSENRTILELCASQLTLQQFIQPAGYSYGSVRGQLVHLMQVDQAWFSDLRGAAIPGEHSLEAYADLGVLRADWTSIEQEMRSYLSALTDEVLMSQPLQGEDKDLYVWQVLLQVANHGTDHRAQVLRLLSDLGVPTSSQDYIFFAYDNP